MQQLQFIDEWDGRFVVPIPTVAIYWGGKQGGAV